MLVRGYNNGVLLISRSIYCALVKNKFYYPPLPRVCCSKSSLRTFYSVSTFDLIKRYQHTSTSGGTDDGDVKITKYDETIIDFCRKHNLKDAIGFFKISPSLNSAMAIVLTYKERANVYDMDNVMEVIHTLIDAKIEMAPNFLAEVFFLFDFIKPKKAIDLLDLLVKSGSGLNFDEACFSTVSNSIKKEVHNGYAKMFVDQIITNQLNFLPRTAVCSNFISVFAFYKNYEHAKLVLNYMLHKDINVDHGCFIELLKSCGSGPNSLDKVREVHAALPPVLRKNQSVLNILIQTYGECGGIDRAIKTFEDCFKPSLFLFNCIIDLCAKNGKIEKAFELFEQLKLQEDIQPDIVTFLGVIAAVSNGGSRYASIGQKLYSEVRFNRKFNSVVVVGALMNMFNKCGLPQQALEIYNDQAKRGDLSDFILNFGLAACANLGPDYFEKGKKIHQTVIDLGLETHALLSTSIMTMFYKCGGHDELFKIYEELSKNYQFSLNYEKASLLIQACVSSNSLKMCKKIHQLLKPKTFYKQIENELVNMYIQCGDVVSARILKQSQNGKPPLTKLQSENV